MACAGCSYKTHEFFSLISDESRLHEFLKRHGVIDFSQEMYCPKCDRPCKFYKDRNRFVCNTTRIEVNSSRRRVRIRCGFETTIKKNSIFSNSKKSVEEICLFFTYWLIGFNQERLEDDTGWARQTVVDWVSFCREVCFVVMHEQREQLGGVGKVVEIYDAIFGSRQYNSVRNIEGQWVFAGIERESKKVFMVPVADRTQETFLEIIKQWILPGTTVMSDCWRSYVCLNDEGFQHFTVNHSMNFVDLDTASRKQNVEKIWRNIEGDIPTFGKRSENYIFYLATFYFRKKYPRNSDRFHHFFKYIGQVFPPQLLRS